jgi:hypothetical protein
MVAFITLCVVNIRTFASYGQWDEMRKATQATKTAAAAATTASKTAVESKQLEKRAWMVPLGGNLVLEEHRPLHQFSNHYKST